MTAVIMQPTYLPWAGYFNLIGRASTFVFLDDVQFAKPSWQMRNRILCRGAALMLSVPTRGSRNQILRDVCVAGDEFRALHQKTLEHTYGKHPFGSNVLDVLLPVLGDRTQARLADLNISIITALATQLGLGPRWLRASELSVPGKRSSHLLAILREIGETTYLSPEGSREYITAENALEEGEITVRYQEFQPPPYTQQGTSEFVSHLSVVDVVAHLGWAGARSYVLGPESFGDGLSETCGAVPGESLSL
jgi:hypothetical protein